MGKHLKEEEREEEQTCEICGIPLSEDKPYCFECEKEELGGYDPRY